MASIEERVEELLHNKIEELGYKLYDVEYAKEGKNYFLRIFIDNENGIDLNDCEKVNDGIMGLLDEADYIKEQYFLEVSSPGIERILRKDRHLQENIGQEVTVNLFKAVNNQKQIDGILEEFSEKELIIANENEKITIERKNIALIKTKYNWE